MKKQFFFLNHGGTRLESCVIMIVKDVIDNNMKRLVRREIGYEFSKV